jgi:hypothetical protein
MSISTLPRRRAKNFSELWQEQRTAGASNYPPTSPTPRRSTVTNRLWQEQKPAYSAFAPRGFASDTVRAMLARPQQDAQQVPSDPAIAIAEERN